jgi:hypothetical protein
MEAAGSIFSAFGLSASAGLNAYIPLLLVGLLAHYTGLIQLSPPWDTLANEGCCWCWLCFYLSKYWQIRSLR